jgi:hypothetical protein
MKKALLVFSLCVLALVFFFQDEEEPQKMILEEENSVLPKPVEGVKKVTVTPDQSVLEAELDDALDDLVTMDELKELDSKDVHETPDLILDAGAALGELQEKAQRDPSRRQRTVEFFSSCAQSEDIATAVRAVCWNKVVTLIPEWDLFFPLSEAKIPEEIQLLASKLN